MISLEFLAVVRSHYNLINIPISRGHLGADCEYRLPEPLAQFVLLQGNRL